MDKWRWFKSPIDNIVKVHESNKKSIAIYERYGWKEFTPETEDTDE
jgi:RimJ/RimL family protein N-acetyltransferase